VYELAERLGPIARELLTAWSRLPARDGVPDRKSFDPMSIARILPVISLLERTGPDEWYFRLVGTEIERRWGRKITGSDLNDIVSPQAVTVMRPELRNIVEWPCGSWCHRLVGLQSGRRAAIETLRLPLRANDGRVNLVLSCSGELSTTRQSAAIDLPREIHTITDQEFFDIGAGCPSQSAIAAGGEPAATNAR
jgi:hypothetical protein